jgi:hypothetical protein
MSKKMTISDVAALMNKLHKNNSAPRKDDLRWLVTSENFGAWVLSKTEQEAIETFKQKFPLERKVTATLTLKAENLQ